MSVRDMAEIIARFTPDKPNLDYSGFIDPVSKIARAQDDWQRAYENSQTGNKRIDFTNWNFDNQKRTGDLNYNKSFQTQPSDIAAQNARNDEIASNWGAKNSTADLINQEAYDPNAQRYRTPEELARIGTNNKFANAALYNNAQNYLHQQGQNIAPLAPDIASQYNWHAGLGDYYINSNGQIVGNNIVGQQALNPNDFIDPNQQRVPQTINTDNFVQNPMQQAVGTISPRTMESFNPNYLLNQPVQQPTPPVSAMQPAVQPNLVQPTTVSMSDPSLLSAVAAGNGAQYAQAQQKAKLEQDKALAVARAKAQTQELVNRDKIDYQKQAKLPEEINNVASNVANLVQAAAVGKELSDMVNNVANSHKGTLDPLDDIVARTQGPILGKIYSPTDAGQAFVAKNEEYGLKSGLPNLRSTFGGNPTEGERKALLDSQNIMKSAPNREIYIRELNKQQQILTGIAKRQISGIGIPIKRSSDEAADTKMLLSEPTLVNRYISEHGYLPDGYYAAMIGR